MNLTLPSFPQLALPWALLLWLLVLAASSGIANPQESFLRGNLAYAEGNYADAESAYREAATKVRSASLHYNLGNSLARQENWSEAAFHYLRSHFLDPRLDAARANLLLCAEQLGFEESPYPQLSDPAALFPRSSWLFAGTTAFWFALLFLLHERILPFRLPFPRTIAFLGLLVVAASFIALWQYQRFQAWAVLSPDPAPLRVAPTSESPAEITLSPGTPVRILGEDRAYRKVRSGDGTEGFLHSGEIRALQGY